MGFGSRCSRNSFFIKGDGNTVIIGGSYHNSGQVVTNTGSGAAVATTGYRSPVVVGTTAGENSPVTITNNNGDVSGSSGSITVTNSGGSAAPPAPQPEKQEPPKEQEPAREEKPPEEKKTETPPPKQPPRADDSDYHKERRWVGRAKVPGLGEVGVNRMISSDLERQAGGLVNMLPPRVRWAAERYARALFRNDRAGGFFGRFGGDSRRKRALQAAEDDFILAIGEMSNHGKLSPGMTLLYANAAYQKVTIERERLAKNNETRWYHRLGRAAVYAAAIASGAGLAWVTGGLGLPLSLALLTKVGIGLTTGYAMGTYTAHTIRHDRTTGAEGISLAWDAYRTINTGMVEALLKLDPRSGGHIATGQWNAIGDVRIPGGNPLGLPQSVMDQYIHSIWEGGASVRDRSTGGITPGQPLGLSDQSLQRAQRNREARDAMATRGAVAGGVAGLVLGIIGASLSETGIHGPGGGDATGTPSDGGAPPDGGSTSPGNGAPSFEGGLPPEVQHFLQNNFAYTVAERLLGEVGSSTNPNPNDLIQAAIDSLNNTLGGEHYTYTPGPGQMVLFDGETMGMHPVIGDERFALNLEMARLVAAGFR